MLGRGGKKYGEKHHQASPPRGVAICLAQCECHTVSSPSSTRELFAESQWRRSIWAKISKREAVVWFLTWVDLPYSTISDLDCPVWGFVSLKIQHFWLIFRRQLKRNDYWSETHRWQMDGKGQWPMLWIPCQRRRETGWDIPSHSPSCLALVRLRAM